MDYPASSAHSLPEEIGEDLFAVYGSIRANPLVRFTRNMAIVRDGRELTLVNPVRMDDAGLQELERLGAVRNVLRLGPMHGQDDPFYVDRYRAAFWAFPDGKVHPRPAIDHVLGDDGTLPFGRATLFVFHHLTQTEGAILLERDAGVLLTCDAIQSYATPPHKPHTNRLARLLMPFIGFPDETLIGPMWLKLLAADRDKVRREFERLLELDFDQLLSAHGTFLSAGAHEAVARAVARRFT
ncbi:MAG: hypothetical protein RIC56_19455 [Pseudomonadales bacterium]